MSMELPKDTFTPSRSQELRSTLALVASYCSRNTFKTRPNYTTTTNHPPITIRSEDTNDVILPFHFLTKSHILMERFQFIANSKDNKTVDVIDISDLEISKDVVQLILSNAKLSTLIDHSTILSTFVGVCKLQMIDHIETLLEMIRNDSGMLDVGSLSIPDLSFILESATNNCHTATQIINKFNLETTRNISKTTSKTTSTTSATSATSTTDKSTVPLQEQATTNSDTTISLEKLAKRQLIVDELIATEGTYKNQLQSLENYKIKLMEMAESKVQWKGSHKPVVTVHQATTIFGVSSSLHKLHTSLYNRMTGATSSSRNTRTSLVVADIGLILNTFINHKSSNGNQFLNLYVSYAVNYIRALTELTTLKERDVDFEHWLTTFEQDDVAKKTKSTSKKSKKGKLNNIKNSCDHNLPLNSLLIAPIQRIPRYRLFLKDMLNHTTSTHVDYLPIKQALEVVTYLCNTINHSLEATCKTNGKNLYIEIEVDNPLGLGILELQSPKQAQANALAAKAVAGKGHTKTDEEAILGLPQLPPPRRRLSTMLRKKKKVKKRKKKNVKPLQEKTTKKEIKETVVKKKPEIVMDGGQLYFNNDDKIDIKDDSVVTVAVSIQTKDIKEIVVLDGGELFDPRKKVIQHLLHLLLSKCFKQWYNCVQATK